jgi:putative flippase GtrA
MDIVPEISNIISSTISVTFVYFTSIKKIFENNSDSFSVRKKYIFYIIYQTIAILTVSLIIGKLVLIINNVGIDIIINNSKIIAKILVTPFIMIINFIFMKTLIEKI